MLNLTIEELQFLANLLDRVNVRGVQGKVMVVRIMAKILELAQPQPQESKADPEGE